MEIESRGSKRCGEAEDYLAAVYGRFTEGFWTGDLRRARALIETRKSP